MCTKGLRSLEIDPEVVMAGYDAGAAFHNDVNASDAISAEGNRRFVHVCEIDSRSDLVRVVR